MQRSLSWVLALCFLSSGLPEPMNAQAQTVHAQADQVQTPAGEWTRFRGPNGAGIGQARGLPAVVGKKDIRWKVKLAGEGHASPVLWGDKLFIMSTNRKSADRLLQCLDANNGKALWTQTYGSKSHRLHRYNSYAASTAAVDADHVYYCWSTPTELTVIALDHGGKEVWRRGLGSFTSQHGMGMSPMLYDGKVIVANLQNADGFAVAIDAATGTVIWKTPRQGGRTAYGTPCVYTPKGGKPQLIFNSQAHGICALDPSTGKVVWEKNDIFRLRSVSSSLIASGLAIGTCGSGGGGNYVVAVRPGTPTTDPQVVWKISRSAPYVPTSIAVGDLLFMFFDGGVVTCVHTPTGEVKWRERVEGTFFGSPICVGETLYCIGREGRLFAIHASDKFKLLGVSELGVASYSTPAVANQRMYLRTRNYLICVGK